MPDVAADPPAEAEELVQAHDAREAGGRPLVPRRLGGVGEGEGGGQGRERAPGDEAPDLDDGLRARSVAGSPECCGGRRASKGAMPAFPSSPPCCFGAGTHPPAQLRAHARGGGVLPVSVAEFGPRPLDGGHDQVGQRGDEEAHRCAEDREEENFHGGAQSDFRRFVSFYLWFGMDVRRGSRGDLGGLVGLVPRIVLPGRIARQSRAPIR